jgi:hypothetical protein
MKKENRLEINENFIRKNFEDLNQTFMFGIFISKKKISVASPFCLLFFPVLFVSIGEEKNE